MTTTTTFEPVRGTYVHPNGTEVYEVEIDSQEKADEWAAFVTSMIAVINSGIIDDQIYEIASACHSRHLITKGQATQLRPPRPGTSAFKVLDANDISIDDVLLPCSIHPDVMAKAYFTYSGIRYSKNSVIGKYITVPQANNAYGKIAGIGTTNFSIRITTETGAQCQIQPGDVIKVKFTELHHLFEI